MLLPTAAPQAVAALQQLQVIDGFQRRRADVHAAAVADLAQIELAEGAVIEARLRVTGARQPNAVRANVLVDVLRNGMRIGMREDPASFVQQSFHHRALGLFL